MLNIPALSQLMTVATDNLAVENEINKLSAKIKKKQEIEDMNELAMTIDMPENEPCVIFPYQFKKTITK